MMSQLSLNFPTSNMDNTSFTREMPPDVSGSQSNLSPYEYYKLQVEAMNASGDLDFQPEVHKAVIDFILTTNKDAMSLLNSYCTVSGQPLFKFLEYELKGRTDKNKYMAVAEFDGKPVYGLLQQSKKDAKKACATRLLEQLYLNQRLNCLSNSGRKLKHPTRHPRPLSISPFKTQQQQQLSSSQSQEDLGKLNAEFYQNQLQEVDPSMKIFAEDIDLDGSRILSDPKFLELKKNFDEQNPIPPDYKNKEKFECIREKVFKLFCEDAFWFEPKMSDATIEKLNEAGGMWSSNWNPIAYVQKCIMRAVASMKKLAAQSEESSAADGQQKKETPDEGQEKMEAIDSKEEEHNMLAEMLEYFVFTLPYIPHRYACVALLRGDIYYGRISESKAKSKISCAMVLADKLVELGWTDLDKQIKKMVRRQPKVKNLKRKAETTEDDLISEPGAFGSLELQPYQFLLTMHPGEELDPRTHFFLAIQGGKNATSLLSEICSKSRLGELHFRESSEMTVSNQAEGASAQRFVAEVQVLPFQIPGIPPEKVGGPLFTAQGALEKSKKAAKASASRIALDVMVRKGTIQIDEQSFADFRASIKKSLLNEGSS